MLISLSSMPLTPIFFLRSPFSSLPRWSASCRFFTISSRNLCCRVLSRPLTQPNQRSPPLHCAPALHLVNRKPYRPRVMALPLFTGGDSPYDGLNAGMCQFFYCWLRWFTLLAEHRCGVSVEPASAFMQECGLSPCCVIFLQAAATPSMDPHSVMTMAALVRWRHRCQGDILGRRRR